MQLITSNPAGSSDISIISRCTHGCRASVVLSSRNNYILSLTLVLARCKQTPLALKQRHCKRLAVCRHKPTVLTAAHRNTYQWHPPACGRARLSTHCSDPPMCSACRAHSCALPAPAKVPGESAALLLENNAAAAAPLLPPAQEPPVASARPVSRHFCCCHCCCCCGPATRQRRMRRGAGGESISRRRRPRRGAWALPPALP